MNRQETIEILTILIVAYPRFDCFQGEKLDIAIKLWNEMFKDIPYPIIEVAVQKLMLESPHPPTIADVNRRIAEIIMPKEDDAATAWGEVLKAIRLYGYSRESDALASLPERAAMVARMMGWQEICASEEPGVTRGQYLRMYDSIAARDRNEAMLPESLKQKIHEIAESHDIRMIKAGSG